MNPFTNLEQLDRRSDRLLRALASGPRVFFFVTVTFSVIGGVLQVLHQVAPGNTATLATDALVQVAGNLIVSITGSAVVAIWCRSGHRLSLVVATIAGAAGGALRLPFDAATTSTLQGADALRVIGASAAWLLMAGVLVRLLVPLAQGIIDQRTALIEMVKAEQDGARLIVSTEREFRRNVAERLHGPVQSQLIAITSQLRAPGVDDATAAEIADSLDRLRRDVVRPLGHVLHPAAVDIGLRSTLEAVAEGFSTLSVTIEMTPDAVRLDDPVERRISPQCRLAVMRCCEETLNNAIIWGAATRAELLVDTADDDETLIVICRHDGRPPTAPISPGLGLRIIHSWAQSVHASWSLDADRDGGTEFVLAIPIDTVPIPAPMSAHTAPAATPPEGEPAITSSDGTEPGIRTVRLRAASAVDR